MVKQATELRRKKKNLCVSCRFACGLLSHFFPSSLLEPVRFDSVWLFEILFKINLYIGSVRFSYRYTFWLSKQRRRRRKPLPVGHLSLLSPLPCLLEPVQIGAIRLFGTLFKINLYIGSIRFTISPFSVKSNTYFFFFYKSVTNYFGLLIFFQ